MSNISNERLREICIENEWFIFGSNEEYERLFKANSDGFELEELATMIGMCSHYVTREYIIDVLKEENLLQISLDSLIDTLYRNHWGDIETVSIIGALKNSPDNGTAYRLI